jgi:hypothetical protein
VLVVKLVQFRIEGEDPHLRAGQPVQGDPRGRHPPAEVVELDPHPGDSQDGVLVVHVDARVRDLRTEVLQLLCDLVKFRCRRSVLQVHHRRRPLLTRLEQVTGQLLDVAGRVRRCPARLDQARGQRVAAQEKISAHLLRHGSPSLLLLFHVVDQGFELALVEEPDLPRADPEDFGEDAEVSAPVVFEAAGVRLVGSASPSSGSMLRVSRSISTFPDRMSSRGMSRPSRRHTSQMNPHSARADPACRSVSHCA